MAVNNSPEGVMGFTDCSLREDDEEGAVMKLSRIGPSGFRKISSLSRTLYRIFVDSKSDKSTQ